MLKIEKGKRKAPVAVAIYGVEGIGKTTFASKMPGALIIDIEKGSLNYDVARITDVKNWDELISILRELWTNAKTYQENGIKTIVFDSLDAIENNLLIPFLLEREKARTIAEMSYGQGYEAENRLFLDFLRIVELLKNLGFNVVYIVHSTQKEINPPDSVSYSHYELKLNKKLSATLKENVDMLLFFNFKRLIQKERNGNKAKAIERVMICNHTEYCDAKNRFGLETQLALDPKLIEIYFSK